jgi:hypothetical protein
MTVPIASAAEAPAASRFIAAELDRVSFRPDASVARDDLASWYRAMRLAQTFEDELAALYRQGRIVGAAYLGIAATMCEFPGFNASAVNEMIVIKPAVNLGIAVALPDSDDLIVPVVHRADGLSIARMARAVAGITSRARGPVTPGGRAGQHRHADQSRHVRRPDRHADPQSAAGDDSRSRRDRETRRRARRRPHRAAVDDDGRVDLRSSSGRRNDSLQVFWTA